MQESPETAAGPVRYDVAWNELDDWRNHTRGSLRRALYLRIRGRAGLAGRCANPPEVQLGSSA